MKENCKHKTVVMENVFDVVKGEAIVMPDECGDSMWDAVLEENPKVCDVETISKNTLSSLPDTATE